MEPGESAEVEWNAAVSRLHGALAGDPSFQAIAPVMGTPERVRVIVVLEPGSQLGSSSSAAVEEARLHFPVRVIEPRSSKSELEQARRAIDAAAREFRFARGQSGVAIGIDWVQGKVRLAGHVPSAEAIVGGAGVRRDLVIIHEAEIRRVNR
jgi:hypothetical protein